MMIRHLEDSAQETGYRDQGVDVHRGRARMTGVGRVDVDGVELRTERIVIATGSDARIPDVEGLAEVGFWTNREATTLSEIPESIVILGGGPVGVELGQFLARFGTRVTIVQGARRLLAREDAAVGALVLDLLREDGIDVRLGAQAVRVSREGEDRVVHLEGGETVSGRELLIATGRAPRVGNLGLEVLGIEVDPRGLRVDERCRVSDGVWAVGDVTGVLAFTHVGMYQARIAAQDIAGPTRRRRARPASRLLHQTQDAGERQLNSERRLHLRYRWRRKRSSGRPMLPLSLLVQALAPDLTADVPGRVGTPKRQGVRLTPPTGHVVGRVLRDAQQTHGVGRPLHAGRTPATVSPTRRSTTPCPPAARCCRIGIAGRDRAMARRSGGRSGYDHVADECRVAGDFDVFVDGAVGVAGRATLQAVGSSWLQGR